MPLGACHRLRLCVFLPGLPHPTRFAPSRSSVHLFSSADTHQQARYATTIMFKKAVTAHTTANATGSQSSAFKPVVPALGSTHRNEPLRRVTPAQLNANSAVKRTASGLAKAAGSDKSSSSTDPISSPKQYIGSQNTPIDLERCTVNKTTAPPVFFDENDFDDDDDLLLEAEDLSKKNTVTYPKLPSPQVQSTISYPQLKRDFHSQATTQQDSGFQHTQPDFKEATQSFGSEALPCPQNSEARKAGPDWRTNELWKLSLSVEYHC
ncbi:hypothetical protein FH972_024496 [Carpinus fangiana]|uniref:Uncharacterized protein n=1 Tax=Carpinus fangiana TaxID=176857 RepID=A0A5N6KYP9_9ROSI|nr:hypothetical protein FH972_024496 [Carpinus fangiana]